MTKQKNPYNVANTYTGIIHSRTEISRVGNYKKVVTISNVKLLGSNDIKYNMIWAYDGSRFKDIYNEDVILFVARRSISSPSYVKGAKDIDIDKFREFKHYNVIRPIIHLSREKNNNNIKTLKCLKCKKLIYYKQKKQTCDACIKAAAHVKKMKAYNKKRTAKITKANQKRRAQEKIEHAKTSKKCEWCGKIKYFGNHKYTDFTKLKKSKDGFSNVCNKCKGFKPVQ